MGKAETRITIGIKNELREHGIFCFKVWQGPFSRPGIPDLVGVAPGGRFVAVEVKTENGRLSQQQAAFIERIRDNKGIGFVARSRQDVRDNLSKAGIIRKQGLMF